MQQNREIRTNLFVDDELKRSMILHLEWGCRGLSRPSVPETEFRRSERPYFWKVYLCRSGVGLATAMLELRRLDGVGDFGPSTLEWPWGPVNEVRRRRTSTSLLLLWNALLLHRLLFESEFEASCFLKQRHLELAEN